MLAKTLSCALVGIDAMMVDVEVDITQGLPQFATVGLPDGAVKESKDRVKAALKNSGYDFPSRRITVNLAPADVKKEGASFDLPISIGILAATGVLKGAKLREYILLGELSLDGGIKPVRGCLSVAVAARDAGIMGIVVPLENAPEAAVVEGVDVIGVNTLAEVVEFLKGGLAIAPCRVDLGELFQQNCDYSDDFCEVRGQEHAKRALEVAAAGAHNIIMIGPPGSGKTMLARRIPSILPRMSFEEAIETTKIYSVMGLLEHDRALIANRPFRSPHHTISDIGLIGGGNGTETPGTGTPGDGNTGGVGTVDPGTSNPGNDTDNGAGTGDGTGNGTAGTDNGSGTISTGSFPVAAAGSTAVGGAIPAVSTPRNTPTQNGAAALANTGVDASLVPLALLMLVAGLLMLRKRKVS